MLSENKAWHERAFYHLIEIWNGGNNDWDKYDFQLDNIKTSNWDLKPR